MHGPQLTGLGATSSRIQHRRGCLISKQLVRLLQSLKEPLVHGAEQKGGAPDPIRERRAIKREPLAGKDLSLSIERQMVGVLGHEDVRDGGVGRQSALNQARRDRRLDDHLLARAAGVFGPPHHHNTDLGWHNVEALRDVLANAVEGARAAGAGPVLDIHHGLDPRQMGGQGAPVRPPLGDAKLLLTCRVLFRLGVLCGFDLLGLFKREQQLTFG